VKTEGDIQSVLKALKAKDNFIVFDWSQCHQ